MNDKVREAWGSGDRYEQYVGRWSRVVAREFLAWLGLPSGQPWADVGCGTGALVQGILDTSAPRAIFAIDRAKGFIGAARAGIPDRRVRFALADATALPWASASCAACVSGLMLNFVPNALAVVQEMARVTRPRGQVALYVWDYGGGMEMMRHFWDAAVEVSPADATLDEAGRFPLCQPEPLKTLFETAGLSAVAVRPIVIPTVFRDFDDYWTPFLGKQGPAPTYLAALDADTREQIRAVLRARLRPAADGSIALTAQAWAVRGTVV
jgi:SAM-dependent methyltransferase